MDRKIRSRKTVKDDSMVDQVMMLRFRPIAPKPTPHSGKSQFENKSKLLSGIRTKRKYVRVRRTQKTNYTNRSKNRPSKKVSVEKKIVTLQLLPGKHEETSPENDKRGDDSGENYQWPSPNPSFPTNINNNQVNWIRPEWVHQTDSFSAPVDRTDPSDRIETRIIVETITAGSSIDAVGLGQTDMKMVAGFVTDPSGRVLWMNGLYEAMVSRQIMAVNGGVGLARWPETMVQLVVKQGLVMPYWSVSFTSRVKIESTWRHERWSQTVFCDVWRMENGGFAWRLDLDAALSLAVDWKQYSQRQ